MKGIIVLNKISFLILLIVILLFSITEAQAICIKNETDMQLYYEIQNKNIHCPYPRVRFHSDTVQANQQKCHAHSPQDGDDWKIDRIDSIKIMTKKNGQVVCRRVVEGIRRYLIVVYQPWVEHPWSCWDPLEIEG